MKKIGIVILLSFGFLIADAKVNPVPVRKNNTYIQPFKQQSKFYSFTLLKEKIKEQHFNFDNVSVSETLKLPYQWRCYDVTYYTDCGTVWGGDLCVYSNSNILSEEQWWNGWRRKNFEHCGYWLDY